ncbi:hypothetical protein MK805_05405 [Shimazuella sp. AN120528]|uniref:hypothetical protein n=1 Tax=Shimazuella soli TaxID=1892854 RepID=UPI001F111D43|nr:hypothetical protein [Shimazuella soli]MCH5584402.1 hypothetical protein [Shimazuella soli]
MNDLRPVIVRGADVEETEEEIRQSYLFQQWLEKIANSREIKLVGVKVVAVYKWGRPKEIKMIQLEAEAYDTDGRKLGGIAILRGDTM